MLTQDITCASVLSTMQVTVTYNPKGKYIFVDGQDKVHNRVTKKTHTICLGAICLYGLKDYSREMLGKKHFGKTGAYKLEGKTDFKKTPTLEEKKLPRPKTKQRIVFNGEKDSFVDIKTGEEVSKVSQLFLEDNKIFVL